MTATEVETPRTDKAQRDQRAGRLLPAAVAVGGLWLSMALSSLFGAAFPARDGMTRSALPVAGLGIWGAVALVSIFAPTIVPVAGLFAPVAGAIATGYACLAAAWAAVSERRG